MLYLIFVRGGIISLDNSFRAVCVPIIPLGLYFCIFLWFLIKGSFYFFLFPFCAVAI